MSPFRFRLLISAALFAFSVAGLADAQESASSIFEIDPATALNGFAVLSGAIVLLFETYRSRP